MLKRRLAILSFFLITLIFMNGYFVSTTDAQAQTEVSVNFSGVSASIPVNVRTAPNTSARVIAQIYPNTRVQFSGWTRGQALNDYWVNSPDDRWFIYVKNGVKHYVSSAFIYGNPPESNVVNNVVNVPKQSNLISKVVKLPSGYYNQAEANKMIANIEKFGTNILQRMVNSRVEVHLVNGPITDHPAMRQYRGVTPRGWEGTGKTWDDIPGSGGQTVIARIGHSNYGMGHGSNNLELHETAHGIDRYVFNNFSSTYEFRSAFSREASRLFPNDRYNSVYPEEYFAEASTMYFLNSSTRARLQQNAPYTYQLIKNIYGN